MATQAAQRQRQWRSRVPVCALACAFAAVASSSAHAAPAADKSDKSDKSETTEKTPSAIAVIDIRTEAEAPVWTAAALEQNIGGQVVKFGRVRIFDKRGLACNKNGQHCSLDDYADAGLDLV